MYIPKSPIRLTLKLVGPSKDRLWGKHCWKRVLLSLLSSTSHSSSSDPISWRRGSGSKDQLENVDTGMRRWCREQIGCQTLVSLGVSWEWDKDDDNATVFLLSSASGQVRTP